MSVCVRVSVTRGSLRIRCECCWLDDDYAVASFRVGGGGWARRSSDYVPSGNGTSSPALIRQMFATVCDGSFTGKFWPGNGPNFGPSSMKMVFIWRRYAYKLILI